MVLASFPSWVVLARQTRGTRAGVIASSSSINTYRSATIGLQRASRLATFHHYHPQRHYLQHHLLQQHLFRAAPLLAPWRHRPLLLSCDASSSRAVATTAPMGEKSPSGWARWVMRVAHGVAALLGGSLILAAVGIGAFFVYDATTYADEPADLADSHVSSLALNPRRGGPKNLPISDMLIGDHDSDDIKRLKDKPRLVILGGGWASVALLKDLNPDDYHVTVVSDKNYFLFTPMLPSATVGTLGLRALVEPIRRMLPRVHGHFIRASAEDVDFDQRLVEVSQTDASGHDVHFYVPYDKLVIAVGSVTNPHGVPGLEHCHFLKDIRDARRIRNQIIHNLELACLPTTSDKERKRLLSFVVCGGGPTGVEFAAELFDLLNEDLRQHFPRLLRNEVSVHLIQSRSHILNTYDESISQYAEARFARDQIEVLTNARAKEVCTDRILFSQKELDGTVVTKELPMGFCLWSTGVSPAPLCQRVAARLPDAQKNRCALETDTYLRLSGTRPGEVYALGDCSTVQNNVADHIVTFLQGLARQRGRDPHTMQLAFSEWRHVAGDVTKRFPQAAAHLQRLDRLFAEYDRDHSGTLSFAELHELLRQIDRKLTSLPATAQRAHQQGQYLARKLNCLARMQPVSSNDKGGEEGEEGEDVDAAAYKAFEYKHLGSLAYVGNSAVFDLGAGRSVVGGLWAMYMWRSVYFAQSVSLRVRTLMAMDWAKRAMFGRDLASY